MARTLALSFGPLEISAGARTLIVYAESGETLSGRAREVMARTGLDFPIIARSLGFKGRQGQMIDLVAPPALDLDRLLIVGRAGDENGSASPTIWADRGGSLAGKLASLGVARAGIVIDEPGASPELVAEFLAGMALRRYGFAKYLTQEELEPGPLALEVHTAFPDALEGAVAQRMAVAEGTMLARDLVNEPPNHLGPSEFALRAGELSALGVRVETLTEVEMAKLGMGALLAVGQGSERSPRLVVLEWRGAGRDGTPVAFVGKGVVFDTGGISIKGAANMEDMKGDMGGAAALVGLFHALASRRARVNAVAVLGVVENMPDGRAYRPGDILKSMSGKTIEVVNTDAEGRLVLADALWFAQSRFAPKAMIDLATLTGGMLVALGHGMAGLFSNSDALISDLHAAGNATGELVWPMPLAPYFEKLIESRFADIKNSGGRKGGSSAAAHFLQHFVNGVPWAHLDIAGTAFGAPSGEINTSWASGFGVALLDRFIRDRYEETD